MGAVDAVIGGVGNRGSLLIVGLGMVAIGIVWRWRNQQRPDPAIDRPIARTEGRFLPSHSSRPQLPILHSSQHDSSH